MKNINNISKIILGSAMLVFTMNSCKKEPTQIETIEVAEEQNEGNLENDSIENDASYLAEIAEIHMHEIEIGKLALQKGVGPDIQKYAQMLITDHTKSLDELKALAVKKTITLPTSATDMEDDNFNKLKEKIGTDFDKNFINMMAEGHENTVNKITEISQKVTDPDVQLWTSRQVTIFTTHADEAKKLKEKV